MKPALITWATGSLDSPDYFVFFKSSTLVDANKYVLTHDTNNRTILYAQSLGWTPIHIHQYECHHLYRDRLLHFSDLLKSIFCDAVLIVDGRDTVFQSDPFQHEIVDSRRSQPSWAIVCDEGEHGLHHEYHQKEIDFYQRMIPRPLQELVPEETINGGVLAGSRQFVSDLLYLRWVAQSRIPDPWLTDQGIFNLLLTHYKGDKRIHIDHPYRSTWMFHGCAMKKGVMSCKFDQDIYTNKDGQPYTFCHQWDRLANRKLVLNRWADEFEDFLIPRPKPPTSTRLIPRTTRKHHYG